MQKRCIIFLLVFVTVICDKKNSFSQDVILIEPILSIINKDVPGALDYYYAGEKRDLSSRRIFKRNQFEYQIDSTITTYLGSKSKTEYKLTDTVEYEFYWNFNEELSSWIPDGFAAFHYSIGLLTKQTYNNWNGDISNTNEDEPLLIREYEYNEQGQLKCYQDKDQFDILSGKISNMELYSYDSLNRLIHVDKYHWYNGEDTIRHTNDYFYLYNETSQLIESKSFSYNADQSIKTGDSIHIYYLENGFKSFEHVTTFTTGGEIFGLFRIEYEYDVQNRLKQRVSLKKDDIEDTEWMKRNTFIYEYYGYGSLMSIIKYNSSNEIYDKLDYIHDSGILKADIRLFTEAERRIPDDQYQIHMLLNSKNYVKPFNVGEPLSLLSNVDYYYSMIESVSTNELLYTMHDFSLNPNPNQGLIRFELNKPILNSTKLIISNLQGQVVYIDLEFNGGDIDITHLVDGVYICSFEIGSKFISKKFIKL